MKWLKVFLFVVSGIGGFIVRDAIGPLLYQAFSDNPTAFMVTAYSYQLGTFMSLVLFFDFAIRVFEILTQNTQVLFDQTIYSTLLFKGAAMLIMCGSMAYFLDSVLQMLGLE